ncbi:hypothetical protein [Clostridium thermarum]|uniref:hypothetical protein n=1 Tax=Clostridium thermarum TaxID=1716543 RepID=UPI0011239746|nr:hypothetical protein [Clostridium thermarum]
MSSILSEIASTFCEDKSCSKGKKGKDFTKDGILIWIVLAVILGICLCSGGGNFGTFIGNPCCKSKSSCSSSKGGVGLLVLLLLLLLLGGNGGVLGFGNSSGNVNTNVINVDTQDDCCEDDEYYEDSCCSSKC